MLATFAADESSEAEQCLCDVVARYQKPAPQLAAWLEKNVPEPPLIDIYIPTHHFDPECDNGVAKRLGTNHVSCVVFESFIREVVSVIDLATAVFANKDKLLSEHARPMCSDCDHVSVSVVLAIE